MVEPYHFNLWRVSKLEARSIGLIGGPKRSTNYAKFEPTDALNLDRYKTPLLKVYCFGPFEVYRNEELISNWPSLKARSIFKYLIAHKRKAVSKDKLMEIFWPKADPKAARRNLHQAIYILRHTLQEGYPDFQPILFEHGCYSLDPTLRIWVDFIEFERQIQAGEWLERAGRSLETAAEYSQAEALYRGDFLEEDLYEDWPQIQAGSICSVVI